MEVSEKLPIFAAEIPLVRKLLGSSLRKEALFKFNNMETKKQVIVYVDGYNFYYGLRNGGPKWKRLYWLDIVKFFERMMLPDQELLEVNYYSARPLDDQQASQNGFFGSKSPYDIFPKLFRVYKLFL